MANLPARVRMAASRQAWPVGVSSKGKSEKRVRISCAAA